MSGSTRACVAAIASVLLMLSVLGSPALARDPHQRVVEVADRCDPETFNAAGIPCDPSSSRGTVTLDRLFERLAKDPAKVLRQRKARGWAFLPRELELREGDSLLAENVGGEFHTFTDVTETGFGGGCVPELNAIFGLSPLPQCADGNGNGVPDGFEGGAALLPGGSTELSLDRGRFLFQCLIHPWMRSTVRVRAH